MEGIVPVPAHTSLIIVVVDPLETFDVRLADPLRKLGLILSRGHKEFLSVVPALVAFFAKLNSIDVLLNHFVVFAFSLSLHLVLHVFFIHFLPFSF